MVRRFGSARAALAASSPAFAQAAGREAAAARTDAALRRHVDAGLERASGLGMTVLSWGDEAYPPVLRRLADPPPVLFLRGDTDLLARAAAAGVGVVGARRATPRGRDVARRLGAALGCRDVPVVSGMALGIDGAAHTGALDGKGPTVAVLGSGADRAYPRRHGGLFREIVARGLVVSEFLPGTPALPYNFPRRNRILAALCTRLVVVEAGRRSGALISVDHALDLGVEVFAVPGPIDTPGCAGSNALLRDGARPLISVEEFVAEAVGGGRAARASPAPASCGPEIPPHGGERAPHGPDRLAPEEAALLRHIRRTGVSVDEIAHRAGLDAGRAWALLAGLELSGWVERLPGSRVRRAG